MSSTAIRQERLGPHTSEGTRAAWTAIKRLGWSQNRLARAIGVDSGRMNRWLHGDRPMSLTAGLKFQEVLGIDPSLWSKPARAFRLTIKRAA